MKLHQLRALLAVSETGSIHEAARRLHLSQPAVSKALRELEEGLGAPLLLRATTGVQLSRYGRSLVKHARVVEQELRHAAEEIDALLGIVRGSLTVAVTPVTATGPVGVALRRFIRDEPQVAVSVVELRPAAIDAGLADGTIDLALVSLTTPPAEARFHWRPLYTVPTFAAVRDGHRLAGATSLADLGAERWLSWDPGGEPSSLIAGIFAAHGLPSPASVLRCSSAMLFLELATETDLISVWSEVIYAVPGMRTHLRALNLSGPMPVLEVGVLCRDPELLTSVAARFLRLLDAARERMPMDHLPGRGFGAA